jgi:hypothetical protein
LGSRLGIEQFWQPKPKSFIRIWMPEVHICPSHGLKNLINDWLIRVKAQSTSNVDNLYVAKMVLLKGDSGNFCIFAGKFL